MRQNSERPFSCCGFAIWVCTCSVQTETVEKVAKNSFHFVHFVSHRLQLCESSATANLPSDFSRRENGPISNPLFCVTKCPHVWEMPLCQSRLTHLWELDLPALRQNYSVVRSELQHFRCFCDKKRGNRCVVWASKKSVWVSLQTPTPFIFLNPWRVTLPGLMMRNQVFLELDSKNMDASVYMTFTPINFNVALLQDIQLNLNFEDQGWVPKLHLDLSIPQFTFSLRQLLKCRFRFPFCKFSAQMCLAPVSSASPVSEYLFLCCLFVW